MKPFIKQFKINNLFGYKNLCLKFDQPIQILIGENGFGKTTVLNALYFLLKSDYTNLLRIKFDSIEIIFLENQEFCFTKDLLKSYCEYLVHRKRDESGIVDYIKKTIDNSVLSNLISKIQEDNKLEVYSYFKKDDRLKRLPPQFLYQTLFEINEIQQKYKVFWDLSEYVNNLNIKLLYFPTYRRVEEELKNVISPSSSRTYSSRREMYLEEENQRFLTNDTIIRFGMKDVESRIKKIINEITQSSLSGFASVSGEMISQLLKIEPEVSDDPIFDINEIKIVLSRVGINLTNEDRDEIIHQISSGSQTFKNNKFLVYFLEQLLNVYKKQKKYDTSIKQFVEICNQYLSEKAFVYDESAVTLKVYRKLDDNLFVDDNNKLELRHLSSGEKQIVSIFSQIYLEPDNNFMVLFDEPELSLSIYWQERLLPDILASNRCAFMLAVTHSPFIFNNELKQYAVGLKEFISNGKNL